MRLELGKVYKTRDGNYHVLITAIYHHSKWGDDFYRVEGSVYKRGETKAHKPKIPFSREGRFLPNVESRFDLVREVQPAVIV